MRTRVTHNTKQMTLFMFCDEMGPVYLFFKNAMKGNEHIDIT